MANLGKKGDHYVARFRYEGKECRKSLKTSRFADARAAMNGIERAIHGLTIGMIQVSSKVDADPPRDGASSGTDPLAGFRRPR